LTETTLLEGGQIVDHSDGRERVLKLRGVRTQFGSQVVHNHLDFDMFRGEVEAKAGADLDRLEGTVHDQKAFARIARAIIRDLKMGDDLPDLGMRARSGFFVAPANARDEVKARADLVLARRGGAGAVRELAEAILRARGAWQGLVDAALR